MPAGLPEFVRIMLSPYDSLTITIDNDGYRHACDNQNDIPEPNVYC